MNKIYNIIGVALSAAWLSSCTSFLTQTPADYADDASVISNEASAESALNGAYHRLGETAYYGGKYFDAGINLAADNVDWTGSLNYYYDFDTHGYSAENQLLEYAWYAIYATVNQANQVIARTNALSNIDDATKNRITAEATVIRSLAFFDLARTWGNVPIVKEATASPTQFDGVKQTAAKEVYKDVVSDVLSVYDNLPATVDHVHITRDAANALLARAYLYLEDWENAEKYAGNVIDGGNYSLVEIQDLIDTKQTAESIFELAYTTSFTNEQSNYWRSPDDGGRHEWGPTKELVTLLADETVGGDRKAYYADYSTAQVPDYYVGTLYHRSTNDDNVIIFRLAEMYLIRAEARAKKTSADLSGALADLNVIRKRSHVAELSLTSQSDIIQAIEDENRVEFALEPHRWFDLVRTGRAEAVLGVQTYQTVFPIPFSDIEADKDLVQNDKY